jgi:hypothetical protein
MRLACAALLLCASLGCVTRERDDAAAARQAYAQCVAAHSATAPECVALRERQLAAQRRYQENAKRAWSCDPAQEQCPTPR